MDYGQFVKKLSLPEGLVAPAELTFDDIIARPLSRADLKDDLQAVNSSIEVIQNTRGGSWPTEQLSEEFDLLDLAWHEREFRDANSFAYVVYNTAKQYVGCFYLYGLGHRTELTEELLSYDVDASWWVSTEAYDQGYYPKLYRALQEWLPEKVGLGKVYYSNKQMP
jgi:hypothetical protein